MTDEMLERLIAEAAPGYRVPADPPLDTMWARIEAEHFDGVGVRVPDVTRAKGTARWSRWSRAVTAIAATLVIGVGIGRFTAPTAPRQLPAVVDATTGVGPAAVATLQSATSRYLDDAALLLASLPKDGSRLDDRFTTYAAQMLTMTRLLLDSPAAGDERLRDLLEDLELVLAQVARLNTAPRAEELTFITAAMDERDVVPRLRTVAAAMSYSDY